MNFSKPTRTLLLVSLMAVLLATLTALQYRWVGELSELQRQQMERTARSSTDRFVRHLDRELQDLWYAFRVRSRRDPAEDVAEDHAEWAASFDFPELVEQAYWVTYRLDRPDPRAPGDDQRAGVAAAPDPFGIRQISIQNRRFDPVAWPLDLSDLRAPLAEMARDHRGEDFHESDSFTVALGDRSLAFVVAQTELEEKSWAVVVLRPDVLVEKLLPALVREHFGADDERTFEVRVFDDADAGAPIYASDSAVIATQTTPADVIGHLRNFGGRWRGRDAGGGRTLAVAVTHRAGSVEAAIGQLRRRNLGFGFGVVFVLGTSIVVLAIATRRAQRLAERQLEFVAGVSHELRTPIAGISSLSQNLADGVVQDLGQATRYGESIHRESRRLANMVEGALHFSALETGRYRYRMRATSIRTVIDNAIASFDAAELEKYTLVAQVEERLPALMADAGALESVVRNLVSNALKFSKPGAKIRLSATLSGDPAGREIELGVSDSGRGIVASELGRIFEPFFRSRSVRSDQIEGSGLGLSLVKEIVEAHGGRIEVTSKPRHWSRFHVYLPVPRRQEPTGTEIVPVLPDANGRDPHGAT